MLAVIKHCIFPKNTAGGDEEEDKKIKKILEEAEITVCVSDID